MVHTHKFKLLLLLLLLIISTLLLMQNNHRQPVSGMNSSNNPSLPPTSQRLVVAQQYDLAELNPHLGTDIGSARVLTNIYEGLVRFQAGTAQVEPCLATDWQVSDNNLVWTFKLRPRVTFHDGTPFNADAVADNFNHCLSQINTTKNNSYINFVFAPVERVEVADQSTVKLYLKYPYAPLLNNLAMPMGAAIVSPKSLTSHQTTPAAVTTAAGTGPYQLASTDIGPGQALLKTNPGYWGERPPLREILFTTIADERQRIQLLSQKKADLILDLGAGQAQKLHQQNYQIFSTTGLDLGYLGFYTNQKPFQNTTLRLAAAAALDIPPILNQLWPGATRAAQNILPPTVLGYTGTESNYNPNRARQLLQQAGYENNFIFTLITYDSPRFYAPGGGQALAKAMAEAWGKAGIKVNVKTYSWPDFKQALQRREGDAFLYGWSSDNGDPDNFLFPLFTRSQINRGQNIFGYNNPGLDSLLTDARSTTDPQKRRELYQKAQDMILKDMPCLVMNHSLHFAAADTGIKNFTLSPTGYHRFNDTRKN